MDECEQQEFLALKTALVKLTAERKQLLVALGIADTWLKQDIGCKRDLVGFTPDRVKINDALKLR